MCLRTLFGYRISKKGGIEIDPERAKIVKEVFSRVIQGNSLNSITRWLNRNGLYGIFGGKWNTPRLRDLIRNEKVYQQRFIAENLYQQSY